MGDGLPPEGTVSVAYFGVKWRIKRRNHVLSLLTLPNNLAQKFLGNRKGPRQVHRASSRLLCTYARNPGEIPGNHSALPGVSTPCHVTAPANVTEALGYR